MQALSLIAAAYGVEKYQILDAPGWLSSEHFDIVLTPDRAEAVVDPSKSLQEGQTSWQRNLQRLRAVLRDRFGLVLRIETRQLPVYDLVQAKTGIKPKPHTTDKPRPSIQSNGDRQITASDATMEMLAAQLSLMLDRTVRDKTGLTDRYNLKLDWTPDLDSSPTPNRGPEIGGSIFTAINEQLGLRLESKKSPVQVYVIEKIERPTEN